MFDAMEGHFSAWYSVKWVQQGVINMLPNTSEIEGVQTHPDHTEYHNHVEAVSFALVEGDFVNYAMKSMPGGIGQLSVKCETMFFIRLKIPLCIFINGRKIVRLKKQGSHVSNG